MPEMDAIYKEAQQGAARFSVAAKDFWAARPDDTQAWLRSCLARTRDLFQPWCMEILFAAGIRDTVRFSELEALLGVSSKTLAAKLRILTDSGFLLRTVHDSQPVAIDYRLTRLGKHTVTMAAPLFSFLHECGERPMER
ncbi:MAG: winged helix-turn-helix transcriptional regulator [Euryarchaeota archaeon]|nr:winged helix-turn-helix transcriptional regulator [Euryarchaeota archaeon]